MGIGLDITTRGMISKITRNIFENQNVLETINWIVEIDDEIGSIEDLALGYFIGSLMNISNNTAIDLKRRDFFDKMYKKSLEESFGKEEGRKKYLEYKLKQEEAKDSGAKYTEIALNEEDTEEIRQMLIPMVTRFREKIRQEMALTLV